MSTSIDTERVELHRTIWRIANDLRGSVDGWDFKSYVLGMLFYRFISENLTAYINTRERQGSGSSDFNYAGFPDDQAELGRKEMVKEKGFYILPSELFVNVRARARSDANLNVTLHRIFTNIETSATGTESERDMKGLFDDMDVNSAKLGPTVAKRNAKLVKLLDAIGDLPLNNSGNFSQHSIDLFGDAYEYLMTMYASEAGKSGGEFFTPQEVSELLARITVVGKTSVRNVYDPACGSGSLLLKFAKVLGKEHVHLGFYGQEINLTTYNLCRINMFLHNINFEAFDIAHGDTLTDPEHLDDAPFEAIVSNPPYSIGWEGKNNPLLINDPRYSPAGVLAPPSKADLAFTMHILSCLSADGVAAIVEFPGVLYRGGAEQKIRQYLIDHNFVDAVIQLPPDLFFGTTIATCIIVLKKSKQDEGILFIDASHEFVRSGNKNKLSEQNQQKILDAYTDRKSIDYFAHFVDRAEFADQDHNLAVSSYVIEEDTREQIDIHILNAQIALIVMRQQELRAKIQEIIMDLERRSGKNTIDTLIEKQCPEGVEFKMLGEIVQKTSNIHWSDSDGHEFMYIDLSSVDRITHSISNTTNINSETAPHRAQRIVFQNDVLFGTTRPMLKRYCLIPEEYNRQICSTGFCVLRAEPRFLIPNFLFHILGTQKFYSYIKSNQQGASYPAISNKAVKSFRIPVPPLEIQRAIVEILDTFTALQKELEARKKQYQYHKEDLLTFDESEVEFKTLGEIAIYPQKRIPVSNLDKDSYVGVANLLPEMQGKIQSNYLPSKGMCISYETDDILIGNIRPYLKKIWLADISGGTNQDVITLRIDENFFDKMIPKFLYYLLATDDFFRYHMSRAKGGKMPRGDKAAILKYRIPVPPLEKQQEIVGILDQFDALVNDLSIGIPAEINARRQQLEYYQNQLLSFKEIA